MRQETPWPTSANELSRRRHTFREGPVRRNLPGSGSPALSPIHGGERWKSPHTAWAAAAGIVCGLLAGLPTASAGPSLLDSPVASVLRPTIRSIEVEGSHVVLVVDVPAGFRRIVLESKSGGESGNWVARDLRWPDGRSGDYSFLILRSKELEILRISGTDTLEMPFPAEFYAAQEGASDVLDGRSSQGSSSVSAGSLIPENSIGPSTEVVPAVTVVLAGRPAPTVEALADRYAAQRASIVAATRMNRHPERLSPDFPPRPFSLAAYARDPDAYLGIVEPGRCWQDAPEESGAPTLSVVGGRTESTVLAGRATELVVEVPAGAPATFTSLGGGTFPNGLNTITVEGDARGRAETTWTASPGTVEEALIVAGSPMASGSVQFTLVVHGPITAPQTAITPARKRGAR